MLKLSNKAVEMFYIMASGYKKDFLYTSLRSKCETCSLEGSWHAGIQYMSLIFLLEILTVLT